MEKLTPNSNFGSEKNQIYQSAKSAVSDIEDILAEIDINVIIDYIRYIVAAVLVSISIVIVLDTFIFNLK